MNSTNGLTSGELNQLENQFEQRALEKLRKHFRAAPCEKHPDAMIRFIFDEACDEILGPDFAKERVSDRKAQRINRRMREMLQSRYGPWVNVIHFRKKKRGGLMEFDTNFSRAYRTPAGVLYGMRADGFCKDLFFTSHSFERFVERVLQTFYEDAAEDIGKAYNTIATGADVAWSLVHPENIEYAREGQFWYLNLQVGVFVLEDFEDVFVVKTFLEYDMLNRDLEWFMPLLSPEQAESPGDHFNTLRDLMLHQPVKIKSPLARLDEIAKELLPDEESEFF